MVKGYTYDDEGHPLTMFYKGVTYHYLTNYRGDVLAMTDESGKVVASYTYDAWGDILSQSGEMAEVNPYRYAGYRYDDDTKLYYLMARYYNPENGVFLSQDPVRGNLLEPQTLNGFNYANNNPVMNVDPSGTISKTISLGFNGYIKFIITLSAISIKFCLTAGSLVNIGISFSAGGAAGFAVRKFLQWYLFPTLAAIITIPIAQGVVKSITKKTAGWAFKKFTKGKNWLKTVVFATTIQLPNLLMRR